MKCYICKSTLEDNPSDEHIIYNAIGGKETSKHLLCNKCNKKMGSPIDANFLIQFKVFSTLLGITRDRGNHKPLIVTGANSNNRYLFDVKKEKLTLPFPKYNVKKDEKNRVAHFNIEASSEKHLRQVLQGLKRQFPNLDIEPFISNFNYSVKEIEEPISFQTEMITEKSFQGATRTVVNIALYFGLQVDHLHPAISFIKTGKESQNFRITALYKRGYRLNENPQESFLHTIVIIGDKVEKKLFAFAEFFNAYRYLVLLNSEYTGDDFSQGYSINALNGDKNKCETTYTGNIEEALNLFDDERDREFEIEEMKTLIAGVYAEIRRKQALNKIIRDFFEKYAPNGLTKELVPLFSSFVTQELVNRKIIKIKGIPDSIISSDVYNINLKADQGQQ